MSSTELPNTDDILALKGFQANIRANLEAGEIKEMLEVTKQAVERFPFLTALAVHCHLVALDFPEAIRLQSECEGMPHPIVIWAMQKGIQDMAGIGDAIFARIRARKAKVENAVFELQGPNAGGDLSNYQLTYTLVLEKTDQAVQLTKDMDEIRSQFPDWCPDVTVTFTAPELLAFQDTASGTLQ